MDRIKVNAPVEQLAGQDLNNFTTITINGGTVVIGDGNHVSPPKSACISDTDSAELKELVAQIGEAERASNPGYSDMRTWLKLNNLIGVNHHRDIPSDQAGRAKSYLAGWLRKMRNNEK